MSQPLTGTLVLDFTRHLPGPYCTDILRRLGARVIKIEPPDGDPTRWLPPLEGDHGALFSMINAGKESVVVDLKAADGRALIHQLVPRCDVVVESYRPGVAGRFGIDAETLLRLHPGVIHCSISGFGRESGRSSHDLNFVALAGLLDLQRDRDGRPVLPSSQIGDMSGALFGAISILAALYEKSRTGRGRAIDISMAAGTRALMPTAEALYRGTHDTHRSFWLTGAVPYYNLYQTRDGGFLAVAALEPQFWDAFCRAIGHEELIAKQFDEASRAAIQDTVAAAILERDRADWEKVFSRIDACVEPVLTIEEAHARFGDPFEASPLQRNFPAPPALTQELGASLETVAREAGLDPEELARSASFAPRHWLKRFFRRVTS